jgi:hypothetical protein
MKTFDEWFDGFNGSNTLLRNEDREVAAIGWSAAMAELATAVREAKAEALDRCGISPDRNWRKRVELEAQLSALDFLYQIAEALGDPYKLFGALKDSLKQVKKELAALPKPAPEGKP